MYKKFIKKEYERLFGKPYRPKYKVGDKVKVERMSGWGIATITFAGISSKNPWYQTPFYRYDIEWIKDRKGSHNKEFGYKSKGIQHNIEDFDKTEGKWSIKLAPPLKQLN